MSISIIHIAYTYEKDFDNLCLFQFFISYIHTRRILIIYVYFNYSYRIYIHIWGGGGSAGIKGGGLEDRARVSQDKKISYLKN